MSDRTPTEQEVRERFIDGFPMDTWIESRTTVGAEFDRWLAEHDREKDGRIETLEARLARVTGDSMIGKIEDEIEEAHVHSPDADVWIVDTPADADAILATIRAVAADERPSFAEAIAPITKQSKQWADATRADEQEDARGVGPQDCDVPGCVHLYGHDGRHVDADGQEAVR